MADEHRRDAHVSAERWAHQRANGGIRGTHQSPADEKRSVSGKTSRRATSASAATAVRRTESHEWPMNIGAMLMYPPNGGRTNVRTAASAAPTSPQPTKSAA